ncbi:MAG: DUF3419 family protein [Clostridia bacterium]|nr:DUF3419 family protein [Clostridia bacterium]
MKKIRKNMRRYYKEASYIHYSNCHEDADFALNNIKGSPRSILTVASSLDNALAFLLLNPESVLAIDYNDTQIFLCKLKKCGIEHLEYEQFLTLLGIGKGDSGLIYDQIKGYLDSETREYFDNHFFLISQVGLINCGRFENYFQIFKKHILSKTNSQKTIDSFMSAKDLNEQRTVYKTKFNNLRFRMLFNLFFSKTVMKILGRDKDYFAYAKGGLASMQKSKFELCVENNLNIENPYLQYIVQGRMIALPAYLVKENYYKIKANISRLEIKKVSFQEEIKSNKRYDFMYLSDIFEYMDGKTTEMLSKNICKALNSGGQVLLYNMMIERHLSGLKETELDQTNNRTFYYLHCYRYEKD